MNCFCVGNPVAISLASSKQRGLGLFSIGPPGSICADLSLRLPARVGNEDAAQIPLRREAWHEFPRNWCRGVA